VAPINPEKKTGNYPVGQPAGVPWEQTWSAIAVITFVAAFVIASY